ncbi:PH domain-containing protein [Natranaerofaba carboxydovora]|uniref:PH domain-containing protein n=1 Tax=Natranaerofaba carboxydovora TaxID=2742683 RepID=UPI001F130C8D|nr:PH domain-containing protein [Natranaerofaba carboxydovora]UMZ74513.1 Bacterial PH domain protein [Natranaerofaba carboxydovora]
MFQGRLVKEASINGDAKKVSIYFPKKSYGWISLLIAALIFAVLAYFALQAYRMTGDIGAVFTLIVSVGLVIDFLVLTVWFFTMRYELSPKSLVVKFGPLKYAIDLETVVNVRTKNLNHTFWPSLKLPGFSIFYSSYKDEGKVFMCATRSKKDIILIETELKKFGITPDKEEVFLAELNTYLQEIKPYKEIKRIN